MLLLYSVTLFVSATLLFVVEPMFAKMALPLLGGTPNVWNTCMVFYQAALLGGYVYAHYSTRLLGARRQAVVHVVLLALPLLVLPIGVAKAWTPPADANPIPWLLVMMTASVGLPFFVVSASAPMLQAWFAQTGHPSAKDPYFLYAASNLGSILALLAYPLLLEPTLTLVGQSRAWSTGYGLLCALTVACALALWRRRGQPADSTSANQAATAATSSDAAAEMARPEPTLGLRLRWLGLALVPSSLLLGVTTYISTDIACVPMFWVMPFILYLLTFVLAFSRVGRTLHPWVLRLQPILVVALAACFFLNDTRVNWQFLPLHLGAFFIVALACHGELAAQRPKASHLTEFYLWMSLGGVLGGMFNAIVAPQAFTWVLEYPLMLVVACLLRPAPQADSDAAQRRLWDVVLPLAALAVLFGLARWLKYLGASAWFEQVFPGLPNSKLIVEAFVSLGIGALLCVSFAARPLRLGLGVAAILTLGWLVQPNWGVHLYAHRNFFGVIRVRHEPDVNRNTLLHGSINHGTQFCDAERRSIATSYYHRTGPLGHAIAALEKQSIARDIAVIGLGTGTIAAYGEPGRHITFYEIDPAVRDVAENSQYFTYLSDCRKRGGTVDVVLGDARLTLARAPDAAYDLIVLDAYSSDAIPIHLVTREALQLYLKKLDPNGILALHISNRFFHLEPVLGRLAEDARLTARVQEDDTEDDAEGKLSSHWVVMARHGEMLGVLATDPHWTQLHVPPHSPLWTDDFSNIVSVLSIWH